MENQKKAIVRQAFEAWASGSGSPLDLLAEHATWTIAGTSIVAGVYNNPADFMERVIVPFMQGLSKPFVPTIRDIYEDGETVTVFFDATATAKDGAVYRNTYVWFLVFGGNEVVRGTAYFDGTTFNQFWKHVQADSSTIRRA